MNPTEEVQAKFNSAEAEINKVEADILNVEAQITAVGHEDDDALKYWRHTALQLREKKKQLREERLMLLKSAERLSAQRAGWHPEQSSAAEMPTQGADDQSMKVIMALRGEELVELPQESQLEQVLLPNPAQTLLLDPFTFQRCRSQSGFDGWGHHVRMQHHPGVMQLCLGHLLTAPMPVVGNEGLTMHVFQSFCAELLHIFEEALPGYQRAGLSINDNSTASRITSASITAARTRPDIVIVSKHLLICMAELKRASDGVPNALKHLRKKLHRGLPASQYSELPFLPAFAQSGKQVQLCIIRQDGQVMEIGQVIDLNSTRGQVEFICVVSNLHRLLAQMSRNVIDLADRLPLFTVLEYGNTSLECCTDCVRKVIKPFPAGEQWSLTVKAYRAAETDGRNYLACASSGPILRDRRYTVCVHPIGFHALPTSEQEVHMLVHDISCGLHILHQADLVHRDVRAANIVKLPAPDSHYMLIDLETVGRAGSALPADQKPLSYWDSHTLEAGQYTSASDMYMLGRLMSTLLDGLRQGQQAAAVSSQAGDLCKSLLSHIASERPTAADVVEQMQGLRRATA